MTKAQRTQNCSQADAGNRLKHAEAFLDTAYLISNESDPNDEYSNVAASLAVLAGIAAGDAACCSALKKRSRSADHRDAIRLIENISPGGKEASKNLKVLIDLKDSAQYGVISVSTTEIKRALRHAEKLVDFSRGIVLR